MKEALIAGTDLLIVRELMGGLYFGQPRAFEGTGKDRRAFNTLSYSYMEVERIARSRYAMVRPGEQAWAAVPDASATTTTTTLPTAP